MDLSLVTAIMGAQTGMMQLAVAARLARMNADQGTSVANLVNAAQQNFGPLANVAAGIGRDLRRYSIGSLTRAGFGLANTMTSPMRAVAPITM